MSAYENIIAALRDKGCHVIERGGGNAKAQCPCPDHGQGRGDLHPSLEIKLRRDGRGCVVACHATCDYRDVLDALGLRPRDLYDDDGMREVYRANADYVWGNGDRKQRRTGPDGKKRMRWAKTGHTGGGALYLADKIPHDCPLVYLVESEKSAQAIWANGAVAVATGGASRTELDYTPLAGVDVIVVVDRDTPGLDWAGKVRGHLQPLAARMQFVRCALDIPKADVVEHLDHDLTLQQLEEFDPFTATYSSNGTAEVHEENIRDQRHNSETLGPRRVVTMVRVADIADAKPEWAWQCNGHGRIQRGVLTLFAGRPGAGKSTAAKYFAANYSQGALDGCWAADPQNVAYISTEESDRYVVKPWLRAAGADMTRIFLPRVDMNGKQLNLRAIADESALTEQLLTQHITTVIVDPLMSTFDAAVDINSKNNEVRAYLEPWQRIAETIDGTVIGIVHLTKAPGGDVLAAITGNSAFGEVPRCVFAFASDPDSHEGHRVMSQVKNSAGRDDLSLTYRIDSHTVTVSTGDTADVGAFTILGDSDRTVSEILRVSGTTEGLSGKTLDIFAYVAASPAPVTPKEVANALNFDNDATGKYLRRLHAKGHIAQPARGIFCSHRAGPD